MSRFLVAMFVGATIAAAVSTSASAYHCLAALLTEHRARPSGSYLKGRSQFQCARCIHRGGGAGCQIVWCRPY